MWLFFWVGLGIIRAMTQKDHIKPRAPGAALLRALLLLSCP